MSDFREIFDACSLLNLYASSCFESILGSRPSRCCVAEQVRNESLFIRKWSDSSASYDYEPVLLEPYFQDNKLGLVKLEGDEEINLFMHLASLLDDGEAATIALAMSRDMQVVTDDKKAIRILKQEAPSIICLSTLDIVKTWSEGMSVKLAELKTALTNIMQHANFQPDQKNSLYDWWQTALSK